MLFSISHSHVIFLAEQILSLSVTPWECLFSVFFLWLKLFIPSIYFVSSNDWKITWYFYAFIQTNFIWVSVVIIISYLDISQLTVLLSLLFCNVHFSVSSLEYSFITGLIMVSEVGLATYYSSCYSSLFYLETTVLPKSGAESWLLPQGCYHWGKKDCV